MLDALLGLEIIDVDDEDDDADSASSSVRGRSFPKTGSDSSLASIGENATYEDEGEQGDTGMRRTKSAGYALDNLPSGASMQPVSTGAWSSETDRLNSIWNAGAGRSGSLDTYNLRRPVAVSFPSRLVPYVCGMFAVPTLLGLSVSSGFDVDGVRQEAIGAIPYMSDVAKHPPQAAFYAMLCYATWTFYAMLCTRRRRRSSRSR